jgi:hypothetical protein
VGVGGLWFVGCNITGVLYASDGVLHVLWRILHVIYLCRGS